MSRVGLVVCFGILLCANSHGGAQVQACKSFLYHPAGASASIGFPSCTRDANGDLVNDEGSVKITIDPDVNRNGRRIAVTTMTSTVAPYNRMYMAIILRTIDDSELDVTGWIDDTCNDMGKNHLATCYKTTFMGQPAVRIMYEDQGRFHVDLAFPNPSRKEAYILSYNTDDSSGFCPCNTPEARENEAIQAQYLFDIFHFD